MRITANGRWALIAAATGLWLGFTAPSQACVLLGCLVQPATTSTAPAAPAADTTAAPTGKPVALEKFTKRTRVHRASARKPHRIARNSRKKNSAVAERDAKFKADEKTNEEAAKLPLAVANANAELNGHDAQKSAAPAPAAANAAPEKPADATVATVTPPVPSAAPDQTAVPATNVDDSGAVAAADQLNDIDRAAAAAPRSTATSAAAPTPATPVLATAMIEPSHEASTDSSVWKQTSLIGKIFVAFGAVLMLASAARLFWA